jgi:hypothetical protein
MQGTPSQFNFMFARKKKSSLQPEKPSEQAKQKNTFFTARS